jgi:hypothetical protein
VLLSRKHSVTQVVRFLHGNVGHAFEPHLYLFYALGVLGCMLRSFSLPRTCAHSSIGGVGFRQFKSF